MSHKDQYALELASTVREMFKDKNFDPNVEEIVDAHFNGKFVGGEVLDGVRKRLRRIKTILEETYEEPVYLLSCVYYDAGFRENQPDNLKDARRCVAGGNGRGAEGIRKHTDPTDKIFQAAIDNNLTSAAAKVHESLDRTVNAVTEGRLEKPDGAELLADARKRSLPSRPAAAQRILDHQRPPTELPTDRTPLRLPARTPVNDHRPKKKRPLLLGPKRSAKK